MTITVVQTGTLGDFNEASLSATSTISASAAGNRIILAGWHEDAGGASGSIAVSDGTSYSMDLINVHSSSFDYLFCASRVNAGGGTTGVTATYSTGSTANSRGRCVALEVSGLAASAFDSTNSAKAGIVTSTTPTVTSGSPITNPSLVICCFQASSTLSGATVPPSGFTQLASDLAAATGSFGWCGYGIFASTAAVTAALGTVASTNWVAQIAVYAGLSVAFRKTLSGIGGRIGVRQLQS